MDIRNNASFRLIRVYSICYFTIRLFEIIWITGIHTINYFRGISKIIWNPGTQTKKMILFFYLGFKCEVISRRSLLYCGGCTYTNVLPHCNAIPQTEDTPSHRVAVYRHIGSDPIEKSFSNLPHHTHIELYDVVMVVVSQTLARKFTVPVSYPRTQCSNRNAQDYPEGSAWTQRSGRRDLRVPLSWEFRFVLYDVRYFVSNTVLMLRIKHILVYVNLQL